MTDACDWDRLEIERLQADVDRYRAADQERYEQHREELRARIEESRREASSWREAVQKQSALMWREFRWEPWGGPAPDLAEDEPAVAATLVNLDDYFKAGAEACDKALAMWSDVRRTLGVDAKIAALQQEIDELEAEFVATVGRKLMADENAHREGWKGVAQELIDNRENSPEAWLNW